MQILKILLQLIELLKMLINSTEDIQTVLSVNITLDYSNIRNHLKTCENRYIKPLLGDSLYSELDTIHNDAGLTPTTEQAELTRLCQTSMAYLALHKFIPYAEVNIGDGGIRRLENDKNKTAHKNQIVNLREASLEDGFSAIEDAIIYIEDNISEFSSWPYQDNHQYFINTATEFNKFVFIDESRLLFLQLLPRMEEVETRLENNISSDFFNELKSKIQNADTTPISADDLLAIKKCQTFIAHEVFARSVRFLPFIFKNGQLTVFNNVFHLDYRPTQQTSADIISNFKATLEISANSALEQLMKFLHEFADNYPTFKASTAYVEDRGISPRFENTENHKTFFA